MRRAVGVACQSGRVFPLTEGMTGAVVARRCPVWFARYDDVHGHVAEEERATLRGVIGVLLEWLGRIIGVCIVFSRDERRVHPGAVLRKTGVRNRTELAALAGRARLR